MVNQRQRWHQLAILGEMTFEDNRQLPAPQAAFELGAPCQKLSACGFVESKERHLIVGSLCCPSLECVLLGHLAQLGDDVEHPVTSGLVRILVDIAPLCRCVRPNHQPEPLQQAVTTTTIGVGSTGVLKDSRWLGVAENGDAHGVNMAMVEGVGLHPRPSG